PAQVVGIFELDRWSGAQDVARLPIGPHDVFLNRVGGGPRALQDADTARAGFAHQVHGGGDDLGVGVVRVFERKVADPVGRGAGEVDLDGDRFILDQTAQSSQLVEHGL